MKRLVVVLALSAVVAATAVSAMAQGAPPMAPPAAPDMARSSAPASPSMIVPAPCVSSAMRLVHPRMMPTLDERLKFTPEQKVKVNDLLVKSEEQSVPLVLAQRDAARGFAETLIKPNSTEPEITAAAKKAMDAEVALISAKAKTMIELRSMLTAEQQKAFSELLDNYTMMWRAKPGTRPAGAPIPPPGAPK